MTYTRPKVRTGLERLAQLEPDVVRLVRNRRIGLLAHPASVDSRLRHATDVLAAAGAEVAVLFGPEHGYDGEEQDMAVVESAPNIRVPVWSLYGASEADLTPKPEWISGLDAVVIDLQDVGSRYYTFVWTAALMLKAAAAQQVQTIVLDRPNPLGGDVVEGAPQREGYRSFVGLYNVAVRHGMTIGELMKLVRSEEGLDPACLDVVTMQGWQRSQLWPDTALPWVSPSPNMPTYDTAVVYPGACLLEGTNLSEGRGTTRPFEQWGAPFLDARAFAKVDIAGALLRLTRFQPMFQKYAGAVCNGVQVHVVDAQQFRSYETYLRLIAVASAASGDAFAWRTEPYEFVADRPAIDVLTGGPEYRACIFSGKDLEAFVRDQRAPAAEFADARLSWLLY